MSSERFGRYEIKSELGRGGFGTVFHAHDPRFKRDVALKVLPREFLHDPSFAARFEREAQTVAALEHSAIVPVYDYGDEDGQPYLVMRYLSGGTLTKHLLQGAMSIDEVIRIISRLAPGLAEAHDRGIVHRDLKPDNILFDQRQDPYITDFGLVKLTQGNSSLTGDNSIVGTPAYMSPEQARGESNIDGRSDIYALGVILFEMLSGQLPYVSETPVGQLMQHLTEPVPQILEVAPDLPEGCESVISQAMAKKVDQRFESAPDLVAALIESTRASSSSPQAARPRVVVAPLPIPLASASPGARAESEIPPSQDLPQEKLKETDPPRHAISSAPSSTAKATPGVGLQVEELACSNCGAPLPGDISPNQPVECSSCGSRYLMTVPEPGDTITCPNCQIENAETLRFCTGCGHRLLVDCVRCHTQNRSDAIHCLNCGANLQGAEARRREMQEGRRRSRGEREKALKVKQERQQQEKTERLIDELKNPDDHEFAIYQLNQIGAPAIPPLVNTLLKAGDRNSRYGAAKALGELCDNHEIKTLAKARAVRALIKALADSQPPVRYYTVEALGKLSGKQAQLAVDPLGALLKDSSDDVRKKARATLQKIGGERAQEILDNSKGFMGWLKR